MMTIKALGKVLIFLSLYYLACSEPVPPWEKNGGIIGENDLDTDTDTDTSTDTDSDADTDTGPPVDCDNIPDAPIEINELVAPRGFHDVVFDDDGNLVGMDGQGSGSNLLSVTHDDETNTLVPSFGSAQGIAYLPDGYFVAATWDGLIKISSSGQTEELNTTINGAYGVTLGPDGMLYVCDNSNEVIRVDPSDGSSETVLDTSTTTENFTPRVANFSPDESIMYISSNGSSGNVYAVDLDGDLNPTGEPYVFAANVGNSWHDGLGVDACGNLYVPEYFSGGLYRITPEGVVSTLVDWGSGKYGHNLEWGSGVDGWRADAIYLPQPYDGNTVVEVVIGVPKN